MRTNISADFKRLSWIPDAVRLYLDHTGKGIPIRELARREGTHASTVMRRVRRCEMKREDPLVDEALQTLCKKIVFYKKNEVLEMTYSLRAKDIQIDEAVLEAECRRVLRRLVETGAIMATAPEMKKAIVTRQLPNGQTTRSCTLDKAVAQAFALKDWIIHKKNQGKISIYEITSAGRAMLKRVMSEYETLGMAEAVTPFTSQHCDWAEGYVPEKGNARRVRYNAAESPVSVLGRRKDKDGKPFLEADLVQVAERVREDFELAQMGPRITQNWEHFMTGGNRGGFLADDLAGGGAARARERVAEALRDLGPGLGDVVLRVCCFLDGIETAERRMGWAARSGKIVLKIALQRLKRHYEESNTLGADLIG